MSDKLIEWRNQREFKPDQNYQWDEDFQFMTQSEREDILHREDENNVPCPVCGEIMDFNMFGDDYIYYMVWESDCGAVFRWCKG